MSLVDIILSIVLISLFCLGLRTLFSDGMIFHFLREPFEYDGESKVMNFLRRKLQRRALKGENGIQQVRRDYVKVSDRINYILKPFLICVICFSSFWGGLVFIYLFGMRWEIILCCVSSAFIIKFINDKVEF